MDGPGTYSQPPYSGGSKDESGTAAKDTISIGSGDRVSGADRMGMEVHEPYYFVSKIEDNNVTFDYRIRKGLGGESNALALLKAFDFPDKVVQDAYCLIE